WDYDPDDGNDLVGDVSFTFYHEDFWKNVGVELTSKQEGYSVKYYKDGRFYVGDFTFAPAGVYLQQVKLRVYVYIWDK
ncbi:MAG: hypothetical protein ACE5JM_12840, partial [Armatimonadota bacterium]